MPDQDLEAIEIAEVIENVISDTVATGTQPENIEAMADLNIGFNGNSNNNRIVFGCIAKSCGFVTAICYSELMAYNLLALHVGVSHQRQQKNEKLDNNGDRMAHNQASDANDFKSLKTNHKIT